MEIKDRIFPILIHADKSRVGKDYAAKKIVQVLAQHDIPAKQFSIADSLKDFCEVHFNTLPKYRYEQEPELRKQPVPDVNVANVVELWIKVGEFFRNLNEDYWCIRLLPKILKFNGYDIFVPVISDHRFDCEYNFFSAMFTCNTLKINSNKGVLNASDGKVTRLADYTVHNYFDDSFDRILETFCDEFIKNMEIENGNPG